jgi:hypothetical protein
MSCRVLLLLVVHSSLAFSAFANCTAPKNRGMSILADHLMNRVFIGSLALSILTLAIGGRYRTDLMFSTINLPSSHCVLAKNLALAPAFAAPRPGSIVWSADMKTGDLTQWSLPDVPGGANAGGGVFTSGIARATANGVVHAHNHSAKLSIETPSTPTSGSRLFRWKEPRTYPHLYYSAWYYFPRRYVPDGSPSWWNVFQWKSKHPTGNDPFFALNVGNRANGSMYFYLYDQNTKTSYDQTLKIIPERQWVRIEAFYGCAGDKTGHVTFWQDGVQIFDVPNVQTRYSDGDCQWSLNNYSNSLNPKKATIYIADGAICVEGRCP